MILVRKITPNIGAELVGCDFTRTISDRTLQLIYDALIENLVIFFRNSKISPKMHLNFAEAFGELDSPHPVYPHVDGFKRIVKLENDKDNPPDTDAWHTDLTFKSQQPFSSILVARSVPDFGGDTLWSSCYGAYNRLPDGMKKDLESIRCIHDMGDFRNTYANSTGDKSEVTRLNEAMAKLGQRVRNLIETHPITKRKFLNFNESFGMHLIGLTMNDSNSLKTFLSNHMNKPEDQLRWKWQNGDIAMWDNRVTMHYAVNDYMPHYRCMHRITVIKDKRSP